MDRRRLLLVVAAVVAVLGVLLVFVYAKGAESRAAKKFDTVEVITASQELQPGESFDDAQKSGKIRLTPVTRNQLLSGATADSDGFRGKVALTTIYPNEQIIPTKFGGADEVEARANLPIPEGKIAISILIKDDGFRVGTFVAPGSTVAVFSTQDGTFSRVLLPRALVLGFGQSSNADNAGTNSTTAQRSSDPDLPYLVTIAVTQKEAEQVRLAGTISTLSIGILNRTSHVTADSGTGTGSLFGKN
ncbi:Flp pilus assembly protein CpaB [Nocardioides montaniterrae]